MSVEDPVVSDFDVVLSAAKAGDDAAWTRLYEDLAPALNGYLRMRGAESAEDLVGETFLHVARKIDTFRGTYANFRSWVFVIAHHRLIDARRRLVRRPHLVDVTEMDVEDREPEPESTVVDMLSFRALVKRLDVLTDDQREVLLLRTIGGLDVAEVAAAIGKQPGTVRVIHHRALNVLKRNLTKDVTDRPG